MNCLRLCVLLLAVLGTVAPARPGEDKTTLRYLRKGKDSFVLESLVTEVRTKDEVRYTSLTDRGKEKMTLRLDFDAGGKVREAEAIQQVGAVRRTARVVFTGKEAVLTTPAGKKVFAATGNVVVTTAPDWSDIFQVIRRYDRGTGEIQNFAGLWIHPTKDVRLLTFQVAPLGEDAVMHGGKKRTWKRYRVTLRSGGYLVWADGSGRVHLLMPVGKPGGMVVLEGFEKDVGPLVETR